MLCEEKLYVRALFSFGSKLVYVGLDDGMVLEDSQGNFRHPGRANVFAMQWSFLTVEKVPREILTFS